MQVKKPTDNIEVLHYVILVVQIVVFALMEAESTAYPAHTTIATIFHVLS